MSIRVTRISGLAAAPMRTGSAVPRIQSRLSRPVGRGGRLVLRAEDKPESAPALEGGSGADDFDDKLAKLQMKKARTGAKTPSTSKAKKPKYDFSGETVVMEEGPHKGDLAVNVALGISLVWLPLTIAAAGRAAFVKYRFTDKRVSVITKAPWKEEQLDAAYAEVQDVVGIGRGVGIWGDLLITLRNGDKVEMRSVPRWQEMKTYVLEQRDALAAAVESDVTTGTPLASDRGFAS